MQIYNAKGNWIIHCKTKPKITIIILQPNQHKCLPPVITKHTNHRRPTHCLQQPQATIDIPNLEKMFQNNTLLATFKHLFSKGQNSHLKLSRGAGLDS